MGSGFAAYVGKKLELNNSTSMSFFHASRLLLTRAKCYLLPFQDCAATYSESLTFMIPGMSWMRRNDLLDVHWGETERQDSRQVLARNATTGRGLLR